MTKCKITVLKTALFEDLRDEYMPPDFGTCPVMKEGDVFVTAGKFGVGKPEGFCDFAWRAVEVYASTLAGGGKVFGQDANIACCNDGVRPVILKLERFDD